MQLAEIAITFVLILIIIILFFKNIQLHMKNTEMLTTILQLNLDKIILKDRIDYDTGDKDNDSEGFIKFISESREQAYSYIEESQQAIKSFLSFIDDSIDHLKSNSPKDLKYRIIIKSLEKHKEKLKNLLPKDN